MNTKTLTPYLFACLLSGCGAATPAPYTGPQKVDIPIEDTTKSRHHKAQAPQRETPPTGGVAKASKFPKIEHAELGNGLGVNVITAASLPIVQVRLIVRAGNGYGPNPAVASLTGDMLKDGGTKTMASAEVLSRIESLGADIGVSTDSDATVLSLSVPKDRLAQAFGVFADVAQNPRFDDGEFKKLKARAVDDAKESAKGRGSFSAVRALFRELYAGAGPYAVHGLVPSEIEKVSQAEMRAFHSKFFVPNNAHLVFAGDIDLETAKQLSDTAFRAWKRSTTAPALPDAPKPQLPKERKVIVCDRKKAPQSDIFVATLAPERKSAAWPQVRVATQVLGGGVAGRLFTDVREKRSLAYSTNAQVFEVALGAQPLVAYAGTQAPKTDAAVQGLMDNLSSMQQGSVTGTENETARRYLSDVFAIRMETIGAVADLAGRLRVLGLPDDYWDEYRAALRSTDASATNEISKSLFDIEHALIVVTGDADTIAEPLRRFGEVTVLDPEKELQVIKTLPKATP